MTRLNDWLDQATRCLSNESAAQVRTEIREHFEAAREAALADGATAGEADVLAMAALGEARTANRQYRRVLLTSAEARVLRDSTREARLFHSRPWLKWALLAIPSATLVTVAVLLLDGQTVVPPLLIAGALAAGIFFAAPFLPIYTPARGRVFRAVKCVAFAGVLAIAFQPDLLTWSWLFASSLWPVVWIEWTRISIRRKLPVERWPKSLYL